MTRKKKQSLNNPWYDLSNIYQDMELDLVNSLKRNLVKHIDDEKKEGFKYEMWQSAKLRDIEMFRQENRDIIKSYKPEIEKLIEDSILASYDTGVNKVVNDVVDVSDKLIDKDIKINLPTKIEPVIPPNTEHLTPKQEVIFENSTRTKEGVFFKTNNEKLKAIIVESKKTINKPTANILRYQEDQYRRIIFKTQIKLVNGSMTLEQAIDEATKEFLKNGISNIRYRDGKSVNIADYAAMCLRTSNHKAFLTGQGAKRKELGITTVLVSQHGTACPLCIPWQNEILIDDVFSGGKKEDGPYQLVSKAVSEGLLHVNCMHDLLTYIDGVTKRPKTIDPAETEERYKIKQDLRKLERGIRKQKRIVAGTIDIDNYNKEKIKLERLEKGYKDFLKEHKDFRGNDNRLKVEGLSNKDLKEHEKELLKPAIDDKIKEIRKYTKSDEHTKFDIAAKKVIEHGIKTGNEGLMWLDLKGNEIIEFVTGDSSKVNITKDTINYLASLEKNSVISLHNHPGSSSFSSSDMDVACRIESVKEMRVIGHDGTKYFLEIGSGIRPSFSDIDEAYHVIRNKLNSKYQKIFDETGDSKGTWKEQSHEINEELARIFNWTYRRELK